MTRPGANAAAAKAAASVSSLLLLAGAAFPAAAFVAVPPAAATANSQKPNMQIHVQQAAPSPQAQAQADAPPDTYAKYAATSNPPPTQTATAVLFDIDGTLADSWRLGYDATAVVLQNNDLQDKVEFNERIYHETCVYATPERLARTAGLLPDVDANFHDVGADLGRQFDDHYVRLVSPQTCAFYQGMEDVLRNLPRDVRLGALTNACAAYGHAVLKANCPATQRDGDGDGDSSDGQSLFDLYGRFDVVHGADSVPAPKPSPEGLWQCAREMGFAEKEEANDEDDEDDDDDDDDDDETDNSWTRGMVYVGDAIGDGRAARAAGMVSIGVTWGSNSEQKLRNAQVFDYIVTSVDELRELLPQQEGREVKER